MDEFYNKLSDVFKRRIDRFRREVPNFKELEEGEIFVCTEAVGIYDALMSLEYKDSWYIRDGEKIIKGEDITQVESCSLDLVTLIEMTNGLPPPQPSF